MKPRKYITIKPTTYIHFRSIQHLIDWQTLCSEPIFPVQDIKGKILCVLDSNYIKQRLQEGNIIECNDVGSINKLTILRLLQHHESLITRYVYIGIFPENLKNFTVNITYGLKKATLTKKRFNNILISKKLLTKEI